MDGIQIFFGILAAVLVFGGLGYMMDHYDQVTKAPGPEGIGSDNHH